MPPKMHEKQVLWQTNTFGLKPVVVEGKSVDPLVIRRAIVKEGLSQLTEISVEFLSRDVKVKLEDMLGKIMTVHMQTGEGKERLFTGTVVSVERLAYRDGYLQLLAELRPWFWMLTKTTDCRIFQEMKADEIIKKVFDDLGFSDYKFNIRGTLPKRDYCVQYRETDYDFVCRLAEEEGIYFYFDHSDADKKYEKLVLTDDKGTHSSIKENSDLEFWPADDGKQRTDERVTEWGYGEAVVSGNVVLRDFDFLKPQPETYEIREKSTLKPKHSHKDYEVFDYPGHYYSDKNLGKKRAQVRMEIEELEHQDLRGRATVRTMATGEKFKLTEHDDDAMNIEYLTTSATHYLQTTSGYEFVKRETDLDTGALEFEEDNKDLYRVDFTVIPATVQYRAPMNTPWPEIPGLHTAIVTGSSGEEIYTDEHGRIKVQFHWDREGKKDDKTTCWIRVATPWSGSGWGMVHIPRVGQEVVVQFEEGDPDRPICTGMLYNKDTKHPWKLPDNKTQSGIKTNSSKGGKGYNELMFEDKKDEELVRFVAEKDYEQNVLNNATIKVGDKKQDPGNMALTVHNDLTETVSEGNMATTVSKGNQTIDVDKGNQTTTVKMGNIQVDAKAGKITMTAAQSIELKVAGSSVKIDPKGVTIKGPMIAVTGDAKCDVKSPLTTVEGSGVLTLKGGVVMIN
ncbi:type VI secretion system tip protein TssI/VgrG [Ruegeria sp. 2205SS24-7]|uniref:type VI secretion system Vgr family protein n=1 Tax=Ruegeria discodermiae TaxID=3064389 RepID=UPI0027411661|nr:type VI secretion system tip protein TssI/VgrG [Ruegeria sp. 2205SS24-7]MDP5217208.1 type VI secretion system tip protein TssI/VgrG [Ruegeria sp. 2205SS24-7]